MTTSPASSRHVPDQHLDRLFTGRFVGLAVADLAYFTAAGITFVALPHYVTGPLGSDAAGVGVAFGAFAITALVLRPVAGRLTDAVGRRPLLLTGAVLGAICMVATAQAATLWQVVAVRLVLGAAEAAFFVASLAALADLAPPNRIGEALSYNSLGIYLGITVGPLVGEFLLDLGGFDAAWMGAAVLAALAAIAVVRIGETRGPRIAADGPPAGLVHRPAVPVALGFLASTLGMGAFLAMAALRAADVGLSVTGVPLAVYGSMVVACRIVFARVPDRVPSLSLGAAALGVSAVGLMLIAGWPGPSGLVLGAAVLGLGVAFSTPAFFSAIFATAEPGQRGAAAGTASVCVDLGIGGGPMVAGVIAGAGGLSAAFAAAAVAAAAGGGWILRLRRREQRARPA